MPVDVMTETVIDRPPAEVAAFAGDPSNATRWYVDITSVEWKTPPPMQVGSKVAFSARFLGRRIDYVYVIAEWEPGRRLVMRTEQGPFPMETTYTWEASGQGRTRMTLRNRGGTSGFFRVTDGFQSAAIGRATKRDLARLKVLLESH